MNVHGENLRQFVNARSNSEIEQLFDKIKYKAIYFYIERKLRFVIIILNVCVLDFD